MNETDSYSVEKNVLEYIRIKYPDQIVEEFDRGSFGKIYRITHKNDPSLIRALKVMKNVDKFDINKGLEEGNRMSKFSLLNCNIAKMFKVQILDPTEAGDIMGYDPKTNLPPFQSQYVCIEMEYYENGTLDSLFITSEPSRDSIKPSTDNLKQILKQITMALKYIQEHEHLIHNDIKPNNILVGKVDYQQQNDSNGRSTKVIENINVYLADFGQAIESNEVTSTQKYSKLKPYYPYDEISSNSADIYALSVCLYEITTGQLTSQHDRSFRNVEHDAETIRKNYHNADILDDNLIDILIEMMNKDSSKRPTCDQILTSLGVTQPNNDGQPICLET